MLAQLPDECIDLVVTSPPYNLRSGGRCRGWPGYDGYGDDRPHDEYVAWQQESLREMYRVIKPTGAIFYNHAPRIHKGVQWRHEDILEPFDVRQAVIWHRAGGVNHNPQYLSPSYEYIYVMAKPGFRRERIEAAGLYEITLSQVSLAQDIVMPLKTLRRAVEKIRTSRALIVTNRGVSTGFALPINAPHVGDSAMFVAPIKSGPMDGPMAREGGPMTPESGPMDGPMAREGAR